MIKGITGVPGSGKSYFAVHLIVQKYYKWDPVILEWIPRNKRKPLTIFSNVVGLKLPHFNLDDYFLERDITYEDFFTVPYMEKVVEKYGQVLLLIDEAQKFFPSDYRNKDVLFLFQYHRHLGIDIILTFQTWASITRKITDLMEFEIRAVRRSFSIVGEFRYHYYFGLERHGGTKLIPDQKIFNLYKSFTQDSHSKPPRPARKLLVLILVALVVFFVGWKLFLGMFEPPTKTVAKDVKDSVTSSPKSGGALTGHPPAISAVPAPVQKIDPMTRIQLGGFWVGRHLVAIDFFGRLIKTSQFTYPYQDDFENQRVWVSVPDSILAQIKMARASEHGVNGFYGEGDSGYSRIGEGQDYIPPVD
jgi:zona occludens toxin (predicted ATPase)